MGNAEAEAVIIWGRLLITSVDLYQLIDNSGTHLLLTPAPSVVLFPCLWLLGKQSCSWKRKPFVSLAYSTVSYTRCSQIRI